MKVNITYEMCGHGGEIEVFGRRDEREWKIRRESEGFCPECTRKARMEQYNADVASGEWCALTGSEKQILWAHDIRKSLTDRVNKIVTGQPWAADFAPAMEALKNRTTEAKYWIDNRYSHPQKIARDGLEIAGLTK